MPADPKTKTILIVDDDESILNLLEILVKRGGFQVALASTAEDALKALGSKRPSLVLLDLVLPVKSGLDVLKHLSETGNPIPVIVITSHDPQDAMVVESKKHSNVVQLMTKPIRQAALSELLHKILETQPPQAQTA